MIYSGPLRTKRDDSLPTSNLACSSVTNRGRRPSDLERFEACEAARGQAGIGNNATAKLEET